MTFARAMRRTLHGYALAECLSLIVACHRAPPARGGGPRAPSGEVWVTDAEIRHMGLRTTPVQLRDIANSMPVSGVVAFDDSRVMHVFSPVSGRITRIAAQIGDTVHRGDALAVLASPDVGNASADYDKAHTDFVVAGRDLARQRDLVAEGAASRRDLEFARNTYDRARAELDRTAQRLRLLHAAAYDRVTQTYTIRADIDGQVIARGASPGLEVQGQYAVGSSPELFTIGRIDRVWVLGDVYEADLDRVRVGAASSVHVIAFPDREFQGHVDWISRELDPSTRTARIRCSVENLDASLIPEMYATVTVSVPPVRALAIPRDSLLRVGDQTIVFVDRGRTHDARTRFESWPVRADEGASGPWIAVPDRLARGESVVSSGAIQLIGLLREASP